MSGSSSRITAWSARGDSCGVGSGADDEVARLVLEPRQLGVRRVDAGPWRQPQRQFAHVADDTDDFNVQRRATIDRQAPADWILRTEVGARQGRIDGDDRGRAIDVAPIERATRDERDAERAEVIGADYAQFSQCALSLRRRRWSRAEPNARPEPARGQPVHDRRGLDAGQHLHALEHAGIETCQRGPRRIAGLRVSRAASSGHERLRNQDS